MAKMEPSKSFETASNLVIDQNFGETQLRHLGCLSFHMDQVFWRVRRENTGKPLSG
jgi:hypothetical protein